MELPAPFGYIGGKHFIKDWIISHFDYTKLCYVEIFGGAGHILFAKLPHKIEIFNDIDFLLINFFRILKDNSENLIKELDKLPYARLIHYELLKSNWEELDDFEKAVKWFYMRRSSFAGCLNDNNNNWGYSFDKNNAIAYFNILKSLSAISNRLQNVIIECKDYKEIIDIIKDEKDIMLYADPPYIDANYYKTKWSLDDHKEMAELLNSLNCSIAISYYETPEIKEWYPNDKWNYYYKESVKHSCGLTKNIKTYIRPKSTELLLTNYKVQKTLW